MTKIEFSKANAIPIGQLAHAGVYLFIDQRGVIQYVGKSDNVRRRLMDHYRLLAKKKTSSPLYRAMLSNGDGYLSWAIDVLTLEQACERYGYPADSIHEMELYLVYALIPKLNNGPEVNISRRIADGTLPRGISWKASHDSSLDVHSWFKGGSWTKHKALL